MNCHNGPTGEVGPRPGHHSRTESTDTYHTRGCDNTADTQSKGHRDQGHTAPTAEPSYRCPGCARMHLVHSCFLGCGDHWDAQGQVAS